MTSDDVLRAVRSDVPASGVAGDEPADLEAERREWLAIHPESAAVWDALSRPLLAAAHGQPTKRQLAAFIDLTAPIIGSTPELFPQLVAATARLAVRLEAAPRRATHGRRDDDLLRLATAARVSLGAVASELVTSSEGETDREQLDRRARALTQTSSLSYIDAAALVAADVDLADAVACDGRDELPHRDTSAAVPVRAFGEHRDADLARDTRRAAAAGIEMSEQDWQVAAEEGRDRAHELAAARRQADVAAAQYARDELLRKASQ